MPRNPWVKSTVEETRRSTSGTSIHISERRYGGSYHKPLEIFYPVFLSVLLILPDRYYY